MACNAIRFQQGLSLPEFLQSIGTECPCCEAGWRQLGWQPQNDSGQTSSQTVVQIAGSTVVTLLVISNITPLDERGGVSAPAVLPTCRTPEEEAEAEIARSHALTDA